MSDFSTYSYQSILTQMLKEIPDGYDKRQGSMLQTALGPAAYALEGFYMELARVQANGYIQTAAGDALDRLAAIAGLTRAGATPAVRLGVFNLAIPLGSRFSTVNGGASINFTATAATEDPTQFQLTAETPGSIGNDYTGPILPINVIPGLTSAAISTLLIPGEDQETDDQLRQRLITALNERPFGGNVASYRREISQMDGVGTVQIYPIWNGGGTVKCSVLGADFLPASTELIGRIQNAIDPPTGQGLGLGLAPIGAQVTVTAPQPVQVQVEATLTLAPGSTISKVQPQIEAALEDYLLTVRKEWADPVGDILAEYAANVYLARVISAILDVPGVINVTETTLNGQAQDLILTQSGTLQQVPVLGTVTLNE